MKPEGIWRRRVKGWRMPPHTICVTRPGPWSNPFDDLPVCLDYGTSLIKVTGRSMFAADVFRLWLEGKLSMSLDIDALQARRRWILEHVHELAGWNLACWCKEMMPCHRDILLELANGPAAVQRRTREVTAHAVRLLIS